MANIRRMYLRAEMSDGDTVELLNFTVGSDGKVQKLDDIEKASEFFKVNPEALVAGHGFEPWTSGNVVAQRSTVQIHEARLFDFILAA